MTTIYLPKSEPQEPQDQRQYSNYPQIEIDQRKSKRSNRLRIKASRKAQRLQKRNE